MVAQYPFPGQGGYPGAPGQPAIPSVPYVQPGQPWPGQVGYPQQLQYQRQTSAYPSPAPGYHMPSVPAPTAPQITPTYPTYTYEQPTYQQPIIEIPTWEYEDEYGAGYTPGYEPSPALGVDLEGIEWGDGGDVFVPLGGFGLGDFAIEEDIPRLIQEIGVGPFWEWIPFTDMWLGYLISSMQNKLWTTTGMLWGIRTSTEVINRAVDDLSGYIDSLLPIKNGDDHFSIASSMLNIYRTQISIALCTALESIRNDENELKTKTETQRNLVLKANKIVSQLYNETSEW